MILLNLYKNKNKKMPEAYGKFYARPAITQTIGIDGLSEHMSSHNTPFSPGAVKGMLTDMVIWGQMVHSPFHIFLHIRTS